MKETVQNNFKKDFFQDINKKEHPFYWIYPVIMALLELINICMVKLQGKNKPGSNTEKKDAVCIRKLTEENEQEKALCLYRCKKMSYAFALGVLIAGCGIVSYITECGRQQLIQGKYIYRMDTGGGDKNVELELQAGDINEVVDVNVKERWYNYEEWKKKVEEARQYLDEAVLGENEAKDKITQPLQLVTKIPDSLIEVEWNVNGDCINQDGTLDNVEKDWSTKEAVVEAVLSYKEYEEVYAMTFVVCSRKKTIQEQIRDILQNAVESDRDEAFVTLPPNVGQYEIVYTEHKEQTSNYFFIMAVLAAFFITYGMDYELQKKVKYREEQLLKEYPAFINRFVLFLGAGMTVKNCWTVLAMEYADRGERLQKMFVYKEIYLTWKEMENGISEVEAIERFGNRIKLQPYRRFSTLIIQNMRKGTIGLTEKLEAEVQSAFESRKDMAKKLGEEASTKLLLPMGCMLLIVMMIIMIPAFMTF